jgi:UDP-N-acetylglucosamine--N-acetylmuramyl-(pentapeptide) pyrophosphoryl-undecaprenol N-acetylglucosamine transferase
MSTLLIMAGGTGGHVFPALTVAENLRSRGVNIVWLGTKSGIEARSVPAAGFDIEWISIRGLRGKGLWGLLRMPFLLLIAMLQTTGVILRRRPAALLGMGGFVAGPGGIVAWLLRRPLLIHEANAIAGLTNHVLARLASRVMSGFPDTFPTGVDAVYVGNPVRREIAQLPDPTSRLASRHGELRLLVVGGSQGAKVFNELVPGVINGLQPIPEVWHQTGAGNAESVNAAYQRLGLSVRVDEFIDDMAQAYGWADVVVCRAGAITVAEVSAAGVATIFVPFPYAVGDHQTANAQYLAKQDAAIVILQQDLTAERLIETMRRLRRERTEIVGMARRARLLARPDATVRVADICMEVLRA